MHATLTRRQAAAEPARPDGLDAIRPLPAWFFAFEGVLGAAYDICHVWQSAWTVVVAVAAVNAVVGLTVLRRRIKLVKAMLRNGRTRLIAFGLIALRAGVHLVLGAAGADVTGTAAHLVLAAGMAAATVGLLWFDQRVTFRALGLAAR
ncbi:hypothetical protein GCM10009527_064230 [Actinomadura nitritigenes]|uniref:Uncharacterized protein n=1 Tax=Actinomadura nitritigenes TaxID=134602 RepID=A0ABS3RDJ4_9ACTN|nr:hypothetical protein [Actinomadura nitritigenes]MBO2444122.1 hypothetical protein [Actinomadura nitritigenes]